MTWSNKKKSKSPKVTCFLFLVNSQQHVDVVFRRSSHWHFVNHFWDSAMILPDVLKKVRNLGAWLNKKWIPNPATFSPKSHPFVPLWHLQNSSISTDTSKSWSLDIVGGFTVYSRYIAIKQGTSSLLKVQINLLYWNVHHQISPWLCVDERPIW